MSARPLDNRGFPRIDHPMKPSTILAPILAAALVSCGTDEPETTAKVKVEPEGGAGAAVEPAAESNSMEDNKTTTTESGLVIEVLQEGSGEEAKAGQTVNMHYTGWLTDGTKFDSSVDRGQPFAFQLGVGQVIAGWDEGVVGMKVGEKRKLTIPPSIGYGASGAGGVIPPNATLVFEVEFLGAR